MKKLPLSRWQIASPNPSALSSLRECTGFSPLITQVLINRGIDTPEQSQAYISPESQYLPSPKQEFAQLSLSVDLLTMAIATYSKIAICGDYDADGMTSTALLIRALRHLGADVDYVIPSRMKDGYGINNRIVEELAANQVNLILTVDNGIAAYEPISKAVELGIKVIITDHHDLPEKLPPADAILNPKMLPIYSPYRGLAGVGVAYVLAISTALNLDKLQGMVAPLLELYTLGTIADLAPLVGVNRRWLKRGLRQLPQSHLPGVQALMQVAGVNDQQKNLKPEDIGFRLGPRINAIGRLADPQIVIDLLTTNDMGLALQRAMQCEEINRQRQNLCTEIEEQAIALIENTPILWQQSRVLVMVQSHWHHGVIGIVASRLKDRYGVPVFLATYEETNNNIIRGSARGIEEFNVFESLQFCQDLLGKFGGHPAAGGFSLPAENWLAFQERLSVFAYQCLEPAHLKPLVKIDAQASFKQLDFSLYHEIDSLQPWGIGNDEPVFWTPKVRLREQRIISKKHLKLILKQDGENSREMEAIAWGWAEYFPLPTPLDIAYKLQENNWNGDKNLQLELVAVRYSQQAIFSYQNHTYSCHVVLNQLIITNDKQGEIITVNRGEKLGVLTNMSNNSTQSVDVTQRFYYDLIKSALAAIQQ